MTNYTEIENVYYSHQYLTFNPIMPHKSVIINKKQYNLITDEPQGRLNALHKVQ